MRRLLMCCLVSGVVVAGLPGSASSEPQGRTISEAYQAPALGAALTVAGYNASAYSWNCDRRQGCVTLLRKKNERFVSLKIKDSTGMPAFVQVFDVGEPIAEFCGETTKTLDVRHSGILFAYIVGGTCADGSPSTPTTGVLEATFFTRRPR